MDSKRLEDALFLAADMEHFADMEDQLSKEIQALSIGELSEDDLDQVYAARADYDSFLKMAKRRGMY